MKQENSKKEISLSLLSLGQNPLSSPSPPPYFSFLGGPASQPTSAQRPAALFPFFLHQADHSAAPLTHRVVPCSACSCIVMHRQPTDQFKIQSKRTNQIRVKPRNGNSLFHFGYSQTIDCVRVWLEAVGAFLMSSPCRTPIKCTPPTTPTTSCPSST
jgi:hypothetical protein